MNLMKNCSNECKSGLRNLMLFFILFLFFITPTPKAKAGVAMGGEITWTQLGKDSYYVSCISYADCNYMAPSSNSIDINCSSGYSNTVTTNLSGGVDVTPTCKKSCNRCSSGSCTFGYGIKRYIYSTKIYTSKIGSKCCNVNLSFTLCCRSSSITTGASSQGFYIESTLNHCLKTPDNSPVSTLPNAAIFCKNLCASYPVSMLDADGDSLIYTLIKPRQYNITTTTYNSPFKYDLPLKFNGFPDKSKAWNPPACDGFHLDTFTGVLNFKPTMTSFTIIAVLVDEWRDTSASGKGKKIKIGSVIRDMSLISIDCKTNKNPEISGINGTGRTTLYVKAGDTASFMATTYDPNSADTVTAIWDSSIANAKVSITNGKRLPTVSFIWPTKITDARTYPYHINFYAKDDACPSNGFASQTYNIYVLDSSNYPNYKLLKPALPKCGTYTFRMRDTKLKVPSAFTWIINKDTFQDDTMTQYTFHNMGKYPIHVIGNYYLGTVLHYFDTLNITYLLKANAGRDTFVCYGDSLQLHATGGKYYYWLPALGLSNTKILYPYIKPVLSTFVSFITQDSLSCKDTDRVFVKVFKPELKLAYKNYEMCSGDSINLSKNIFYLPNLLSWRPANGIHKNISGLFGKPLESGYITFMVKDTNGCTVKDSSFFKVNNRPAAKFNPAIGQVCRNEVITVWACCGGNKYDWYSLPKNKKFFNGNPATFVVKDSARVYVVISDSDYVCPASVDTLTIDIFNKIQPVITYLSGDDSLVVSKRESYQWYYNSSILKGNARQKLKPYSNGIYSVVTMDNNECSDTAYYTYTLSGTEEIYHSSDYKIYPNPANEKLFVETLLEEYTLQIFNVFGVEILKAEKLKEIDISALAVGVYIIRVNNINKVFIKK